MTIKPAAEPRPGGGVRDYAAAALLALAMFLLLLATARLRPAEWMNLDTSAYLATARNVAAGRGCTQDFITHYMMGYTSVSHPMIDRRPLVPLLGGAALRLLPGWRYSPLLLNFACSALAVALAFLAARWLGFSRRNGLLAAAMVAGNHAQWGTAFYVSAELPLQAWMCVTLLLLWRAARGASLALLPAGAAAGMCWLTRNQGMLLLGTVLLTGLGLAWRGRAWRPLLLAVAGAALGLALNLPWQFWAAAHRPADANLYGGLFAASEEKDAYSLAILSGQQTLWQRPAREVLTIVLQSMHQKIDRVMVYYPFPFTIALAVGLAAYWRRPLALLCGLQYLIGFFSTLVIMLSSRGVLGEYLYLLPLLAPFAARGCGILRDCLRLPDGWRGRLTAAAAVLLLAYLAGNCILAHYRIGRGALVHEQYYRGVRAWLATVPPGTVIMLQDAPTLNWYTGYPAILLPYGATHDELVELARKFGAAYMVHNGLIDSAYDLYSGQATDPRFVPVHEFPAEHSHRGYGRIYRIATQP